jgi:signal transduction histidine kinase
VNLPTLDADPNQLQVVLENLLTNALIHNPPGRTVRIQAAVAGMLSPRQGSCLYCSVTDDGHGITQAQRDRLFRLYIRGLDNSHLTGIGLGLNRCQRIIAAHNGSIGVDSQAEQGATFWFTLPLDLESSQDESDTSPLGHSDYSL